jgi:YidC/Oxa1 family membrane protein insertase
MSNNPRVFLWIAFALLLWLNYEAWMKDYGPRPGQVMAPGVAASGSAPPSTLANTVPKAGASTSAQASASVEHLPSPGASSAELPGAPAAEAPLVHVHTDVQDLEISTRGGTIQRAALPKYPVVKGHAEPVVLENNDTPQTQYLLQSGLTGPGQGPYPDHLAAFTSAQRSYELGGKNELRVPLTWTNGQGVTFTKTFIFHRGEYRILLEQELKNAGRDAVQVAPYLEILRNDPRTKSSMFNIESRTFHGPAFYDGTKYRTLKLTDSDDTHLSQVVTGGWIAAVQHHFVTAAVPTPKEPFHITMTVQGDQYLLAATGATVSVPAGKAVQFPQSVFVGPQLQSQLDRAGPNLGLVTDYKPLTLLARPLFSLLSQVERLTGNWGIAIILVTFLLKLVFYPLQETAGRSMAKMKNLAPRIKNLQETYKDDREKQTKAMMELYQREKINPVGGCLPILVQIPVFLAFYWVLLYSVEMRQAPFLFWIRDLSAQDPLYILPAIMAGAMFLQYRMNPPTPDPVQAKVMMFMPFVFSFTFAFFPAGLVLYWVTNTLLGILQQWNINRRLAVPAPRKA